MTYVAESVRDIFSNLSGSFHGYREDEPDVIGRIFQFIVHTKITKHSMKIPSTSTRGLSERRTEGRMRLGILADRGCGTVIEYWEGVRSLEGES